MPPIPSNALKYFTRKNSDEAECMKCKKIIKCVGTTTGLLSHLRSKHKIDDINKPNAATQPSLSRFIVTKKRSMEEEISRLAALDGFSFNKIATSNFIQNSLRTNTYDKTPPRTGHAVSVIVKRYYKKIKCKTIEHFQKLINEGKRFSLTIDEYTASNNIRFMNINVHYKEEHWSLGLVEIRGSCNTANVIAMVKKRLSEFKLDLDQHIVACTTDGASVMVKFGKETSPHHQECHAHGIHLGVTKELYKTKLTYVQQNISDTAAKDSDINLIGNIPEIDDGSSEDDRNEESEDEGESEDDDEETREEDEGQNEDDDISDEENEENPTDESNEKEDYSINGKSFLINKFSHEMGLNTIATIIYLFHSALKTKRIIVNAKLCLLYNSLFFRQEMNMSICSMASLLVLWMNLSL